MTDGFTAWFLTFFYNCRFMQGGFFKSKKGKDLLNTRPSLSCGSALLDVNCFYLKFIFKIFLAPTNFFHP
jgi:hypothetical protein